MTWAEFKARVEKEHVMDSDVIDLIAFYPDATDRQKFLFVEWSCNGKASIIVCTEDVNKALR